jgi:hypothetical protein
MKIRCGSCKGRHETVDQVRDCYQGKAPQAAAYSPADKSKLARQLGEKLPDLPHARYAVEIDDELRFYQIDKPTEGKWAGRTFVNVQASDDRHPIRNIDSQIKILAVITVDPTEALKRYGREIGECGHCHRTLTNPESRQYGVGPICRQKLGW